MGEWLRKSGIDTVGNVPWGTHFCQFYQTKEDLMEILIPYFKAGLENNEFCLWVTSQPLEVEEAKETLRRAVPYFDIYSEKGQIEIIPYTDWYVREGVFDSKRVSNIWVEELNNALAKGYDGLRLSENTFWLEKTDRDNFVDYEEEIDSIIGNYPMVTLCIYSLDRCNATEIVEAVNDHQFALVKKEGRREQIESSSRRNITERKLAEEAVRQREQLTSLKLEKILSPAREIVNLELAEIIDAQAIQSLMEDFYKLAHIPVGIIDLKGRVLVGVGWQDICTRFHRAHPESCKHCLESDTQLSMGVLPGESKLYKCKNNMWDMVTPIMVGGQHVGNIFLGQFFFESEPLDYELFRSQARQYDFNEEAYIAALEKVPRLSRETVNTIMVFFMKLANVISQLGYSNLKLARSLAERDALVDALRESEEKYRSIIETANEGIWIIDPEAITTYANKKMAEMLGCAQDELIGRSGWDFIDEEDKAIAKLNLEKREQGIDESLEFKFIRKDGSPLWAFVNTKSSFDKDGKFLGSMSMLTDITERKKAEEALKKTLDNLEEQVEARTAELEKSYNLLKESEKGLAEAQKMAHIGNWDWNILTGEIYWSDELYRIFGRNPQESGASYEELFNYIHPDDREYVHNAIKKRFDGKRSGIDYRIIRANGEECTVHAESEVIFDPNNTPIRVKGIIQDITERKEAEEKIQSLANIVESSNDAIITESLDGVITSWNKGAEQVYGYSAEEILGKPISIFDPDILVEETKKLAELVKQGEKVQQYETLRLRKDGTIINVSITLSPVFDSRGKLTAISAIYRDITERKRVEEKIRESEEKYRNIVETANEGICIIDTESIVTYANKKMTDMLGYALEEGIGRPIWDFISEECKAIAKLNLEKRLQGISESYEYKLIRKDGSSLWALISSKSLFDKDGKFMGSMSMLTDITKRKEAEEALAKIEIARKKEIHHRIKNNLQVISSLLDLQAEKFKNRECIKDSEVFAAFRESQDRVISIALIHEELHEGGENDTLNFSPYLERLVDNLFQTYRLGNAVISLNMDLEEDVFFDMDIAVPLGLIVNEIVSNSLKHAFPGWKNGEIQIKLSREKSGKYQDRKIGDSNEECKSTSYILIVSDNGIGIPESVNLEDSDTLGIQLVTILVEQLDGKLELKRDSGTEFVIRFTVAEKQ